MNKTHRVERGLVLRTTAYKDADVMLTLLTEVSGKISVIARGARRKGSRIGAAIEPLAFSEFTLYSSGSSFSLNEAESLELFYELRNDIEALTLGNYIAEVSDIVSDSEVADPHVLRLALNSLYALSRKTAPREVIKAAFELKIACLAGYQPDIFFCSACDKPAAEGRFNIENAAIYCNCCPGYGMTLDAGALSAMRYVIGADIKRVFSFKLGAESLKKMGDACETYLKYHLDCDFKSLSMYKGLTI
ncbi:MAG: DNA repair protein RecO [Clostridia bacterium]|nr:DNA repair protein RecO [Clostridia bacterium]